MQILFHLLFLFGLNASAQPIEPLFWGPNFHEIDRGKYYRSAQLSGEDFEKSIRKYGIRTVINLRGANPQEDWYREEISTMRKLGVQHHDIGMSADRLPHRADLLKLLDLFKSAPRPILVHCQAGADRTGEASALYQMLYNNKSRDEALDMLTLWYHHGRWFKPAKSYFIRDVWQGEDWAYKSYNPCSGRYKYYDIKDPHCRRNP